MDNITLSFSPHFPPSTILNFKSKVQGSIHFHTSCSETLRVGDGFGHVLLVGFSSYDGTGDTKALQSLCLKHSAIITSNEHFSSSPTVKYVTIGIGSGNV